MKNLLKGITQFFSRLVQKVWTDPKENWENKYLYSDEWSFFSLKGICLWRFWVLAKRSTIAFFAIYGLAWFLWAGSTDFGDYTEAMTWESTENVFVMEYHGFHKLSEGLESAIVAFPFPDTQRLEALLPPGISKSLKRGDKVYVKRHWTESGDTLNFILTPEQVAKIDPKLIR